jgi:Ser/Thr protein kinase RdoA (MazF antagonist)
MTAASAIDHALLGRVLGRFGREMAHAGPLGSGLINRTFRVVTSGGETLVLQQINPIFSAAIHDNVRAVTEHLVVRGLMTPRIVPATDGRPCADLGPDGVWRLMTFVAGATFDVAVSTAQVHAAGHLVGRFHAALEDLRHEFVGLRTGVHDTERHLQILREALAEHAGHRLAADVLPLGRAILAAAGALPPLPALPPRICHGDLKFNNLLFVGTEPPGRDQALCLVDLDTVGPMSLAHELGDAWRSWCNPQGEDREDAHFDLEVFAASLAGYREGLGRSLTADERQALLFGVEWISLELAARFAADALRECYFGWDAKRFPGRGEHNLRRARSQWNLHQAAHETRAERALRLGCE